MSSTTLPAAAPRPLARHRLTAALMIVTSCAALLGVAALIHTSAANDSAAAHDRRRNEAHLTATQLATRINTALDFVYTSVRTISKLPSVRAIDRHAANLSDNDRTTIQEIYNNLYSHVHVSEIYITPAEFNPELTDPKTGKPEEPAIMFDDNIVGQTGESKTVTPTLNTNPTVAIPEIEIHEYREIVKQITAFRSRFGMFGTMGLNIPTMISREIVTCDNSRYLPGKPDDKDRSGIIYSVPYYGPDGTFRGVISAIILTGVFTDMLGDGPYALYDQSNEFLVMSPTVQRDLAASLPMIRQIKPDPGLIYSEVLPVSYHDSGAGIFLWSGLPNTAFTTDAEIAAIRHFERYGYLLTAALGLMLAGAYLLYRRQRAQEAQHVQRELKLLAYIDKAKSEFLGNISRELRTPLRSVLGQIHISLEHIAKGEHTGIQKYLGTAQLAAYRLLRLINDLLDLTELETGQTTMHLAKGDFPKAIADSCAALRPSMEQRRVQTDVRDNASGHAVQFDQKWITQVITHIMTNAARYALEDSTITINLDRVQQGARGVLRCSIANNGPQIPEAALDSIFDKFVRAGKGNIDAGSTGLGLAICREVMTRHQGRLWAENIDPAGVIFVLELPLEPGA